jgi:hypothetical protein
MSLWAFSGSFQKSGRSESAFSSSRRTWARSQSKTPPQQGDGGFDLFGEGGDVGAHVRDEGLGMRDEGSQKDLRKAAANASLTFLVPHP